MTYADMTFGLNNQALAVAQFLAGCEMVSTERVEIRTSPWYNGRERGIVFTAWRWTQGYGSKVLHVAVFEHRNSDSLCALRWIGEIDLNPPTLESDGKLAYPTDSKWDVAHQVEYGHIGEMASWVKDQIDQYLAESKPEPHPTSKKKAKV